MHELPSYLALLVSQLRISRSQVSASGMRTLRPLFAGGILGVERSGGGEVVVVRDAAAFEKWLRMRFPFLDSQVTTPVGADRAKAVALRRNSKATGEGVAQGVLHLRAWGAPSVTFRVDGREVPVAELTASHGIAACLLGSESVIDVPDAKVLLVENLECFLRAEALISDTFLALNAAGRIPDRLINCLARSRLGNQPLLHFPDYDPVGLSDYLRLKAKLGDRVVLYVPDDLEERFERFGNRKLISDKPKNRILLEQLNRCSWPCKASERVFKLIKESGAGLEQEALLLGLNGQLGENSNPHD